MSSSIAWSRLVAEGGAIVVSILLAFAIDAAWDSRQARDLERQVLLSLREELLENQALLNSSIDEVEGVRQSLRTILELAPPALADMSASEAVSFMPALGSLPEYEPQVSQIESMLASGDVALVTSSDVRRDLSRWRTAQDDLADQGEVVERAFYGVGAVTTDHNVLAAGLSSVPLDGSDPLRIDAPSLPAALASMRSDPRFSERAAQLWASWRGYRQMLETLLDVLSALLASVEAELESI